MSLTPAFLDELRARTTLSALVGRTVKITRAGREWKGCCPFHNEKTPSFYINDDKGFYHCFGCSAHGDAIRWLTDQQGLPFIDAVKELAQAAGMDMPEADPRAAQKAEMAKGLHDVMQAAADWFEAQLGGIDGASARALLVKRGISDETRRKFNFGYAPDSRGKLRAALKEFGDAMLIEAGLLIKVDDKEPYDRFRGRLMIPIRDQRGRVIAFGGRIIGDGEPKYLNSPDTPLFDKGRTLYNLDKASAASRKAGRIIAVEGYMDVVALAGAGFAETVAPLGTALTEHQLERLWRMADVPLLSFDGDSAGQKAAIRAAHRALPLLQPGRSLNFVKLPEGQDPDDLVRAGGAKAFEQQLFQTIPLSQLVYQSERALVATVTPEGRAGLRANLQEHANSIQHGLVRSEYGRTFNDLFFEDFGWKRNEREAIKSGILSTGMRANPQVMRLYMRSALYGLSRFPLVLALMCETIGMLHIAHEELLPWREALVDAVINRPTLDQDSVKAILATKQLSQADRQDIQFDLRFPWDVTPTAAERTLSGLVRLLASEQELDQRMVELNARIAADPSLTSYDSIEATRQKLRWEKNALYDRAFHLGLDEGEMDAS